MKTQIRVRILEGIRLELIKWRDEELAKGNMVLAGRIHRVAEKLKRRLGAGSIR